MTFKTSVIDISGSSCFTCGGGGAHMELPMLIDMSNMTKSNHHSMTHMTIVIIFIWCDNSEIESSIKSLLFGLNHEKIDNNMLQFTCFQFLFITISLNNEF
jgi:hypothetical protein